MFTEKGLFSLIFFKEMYWISQENLYVDTGASRLNNVLELVDTFLSDHHQESHNTHQGKITQVTRKVN